jgi:hypothetical protein
VFLPVQVSEAHEDFGSDTAEDVLWNAAHLFKHILCVYQSASLQCVCVCVCVCVCASTTTTTTTTTIVTAVATLLTAMV